MAFNGFKEYLKRSIFNLRLHLLVSFQSMGHWLKSISYLEQLATQIDFTDGRVTIVLSAPSKSK